MLKSLHVFLQNINFLFDWRKKVIHILDEGVSRLNNKEMLILDELFL